MCAMKYISDLANPYPQFQTPTTSAEQPTPAKTLAEATNGARIPGVASSVPSSPDSDPVVGRSDHKKAGLGSSGGEGGDEPEPFAQVVSVCRRLGLTMPRFEVTAVCPTLLLPCPPPRGLLLLVFSHPFPTLLPSTSPHTGTNNNQDETHRYFNARPIFPDTFPADFPPDLGVVTDVPTKRAAKDASAQRVLAWLWELERERDADFGVILSKGRF